MNSDTTNIIRSAVFLLCALPSTVSLANRLNVGTDVVRKQIEVTPAQQAVIDLKNIGRDGVILVVMGKNNYLCFNRNFSNTLLHFVYNINSQHGSFCPNTS